MSRGLESLENSICALARLRRPALPPGRLVFSPKSYGGMVVCQRSEGLFATVPLLDAKIPNSVSFIKELVSGYAALLSEQKEAWNASHIEPEPFRRLEKTMTSQATFILNVMICW